MLLHYVIKILNLKLQNMYDKNFAKSHGISGISDYAKQKNGM